jgi:hypothetical protein
VSLKIRSLLVALLVCVAVRVQASAEPDAYLRFQADESVQAEKPAEKVSFALEAGTDGPTVAYQIMRTFLTDEQWSEQVSALQQKFAAWEKENDGDIGRYLNDRFLVVALGAASGEIEKMKRSVVFLAFYKEFGQPPPTAVANALKKHKGSLSELFTDFTWEKAAEYIKNKGWRNDLKGRKTEVVVVDKSKDS